MLRKGAVGLLAERGFFHSNPANLYHEPGWITYKRNGNDTYSPKYTAILHSLQAQLLSFCANLLIFLEI